MTAGNIRELLRAQLLTETTQWSLGTFGAIAEFMRDPGEPVAVIDEPDRLAAVTDRGGIGFVISLRSVPSPRRRRSARA